MEALLPLLNTDAACPTEAAGAYEWTEEGGWDPSGSKPPSEIPITVYLDREELATLMCSPDHLSFLVAWFLRSEGIIQTLDDIALMRVCDEEQVVDVRLLRPSPNRRQKRILTSGCGGGSPSTGATPYDG